MIGSGPKPGERVKDVSFGEDTFSVDLMDGRTITVPYAWYPRPLHATLSSEPTGRQRAAATASTGPTSMRMSVQRGFSAGRLPHGPPRRPAAEGVGESDVGRLAIFPEF